MVQSVFGIPLSPISGVGADAFDVHWNLLGLANAAHPGEVISFYGTGAGPIATSDAVTPPAQNLAAVPIEVDIGGIPATVLYHGRSGYPGLDQVNVVIPPGVVGCNVSLAVISSGLVSNFTTLPIAQQGRSCSDQVAGVSLPQGISISPAVDVTLGALSLYRTVEDIWVPTSGLPSRLGSVTEDSGSAWFERLTYASPVSLAWGLGGVFPSLGSCWVHSWQSLVPVTADAAASPRLDATRASVPDYLNAGPSVSFTGPSGEGRAPFGTVGTYHVTLGGGTTNLPLFLPSDGGAISIDNGAGGPDIGAFRMRFQASPLLVWTNMNGIPPIVDRTSDLTIAWSAGNPSGIVLISASASSAADAATVDTEVDCTAAVEAGQFTIPASAMLALPPSSPGALAPNGNIVVKTIDQLPFSAPGVDGGLLQYVNQSTLNLSFR